MDLEEMAPKDEPTITKMLEYTEQFGGGQLGMVLVRGNPAPDPGDNNQHLKGRGSMKDIEVLDEIDALELQLKRLKDPDNPDKPLINPPISVVDVMKMIKVPESLLDQLKTVLPTEFEDRVDQLLNTSFWDAIHTAGAINSLIWEGWYGKSVQDSIINIFYLSLTDEMRGFLVNDEYSKALIYIDMPTMDAVKTEKAVDKVNKAVSDYSAGKSTSKLTGFAALIVAVNNLLMFNSMFSLFMALIVVFFVLIIIFRSLRLAALTMIPVSMVVAWEPFTLGVTGIDLNLVTAMIGSIIVGIGIDYGIHMTERVQESGENFAGIKESVGTSGFSFLEATATIVAGLLSIFLINIQSIQEFIIMIIILLVFSMVGAMFLLPAIYAMLNSEKSGSMEFKGGVDEVEVEPEYLYD
jgi:predicted RND superfamily exporter protein